MLIQDAQGNPPDQSDLQTWANQYGITFPILADPDYAAWNLYDDQGYIPLNLVIDRELVIRYKDVGYSEAAIKANIENLL